MSWSPDGKSLVYAAEKDNNWNIYTASITRKQEPYFFASTVSKQEPVVATPAEEFQPAFSPDGKEIAYLENRTTLKVYNIASKQSRVVLKPEYNYSYADGDQYYTWSPDSKEICFKAQHKQGHTEFAIVSVGSDLPTIRRRIPAEGFHEDIAWHPDGTQILIPKAPVEGARGQIYAFNPATHDAPTPLPGQPKDRHNAGMCWSRDGKTLFFVSFE